MEQFYRSCDSMDMIMEDVWDALLVLFLFLFYMLCCTTELYCT
jgi:hypothetical protein